nr:alpha-xenorhabdolysin family binary toxin subunit B [uncultured Pseudomonas sp.]
MNPEQKVANLPDVKVLLAAGARISIIYRTEIPGLLPAVRENLMELVNLVSNANKELRRQTLAGLVLLNNDLDEFTAVSEENGCDMDLLRLRQSVQAGIERIKGEILAVDAYVHPDLSPVTTPLEKKLQKQETAVAEQQENVNSRAGQLKALKESLAVLNTPTISTLIRGQLPSDEEIDIILKTFTDQRVTPDLVKAAVNRLNKNLELIEQGRELSKLNAALTERAAALDQERPVLKRLQAEVAKTKEQLAEYEAAQEMVELRQAWLNQASVFVDHCKLLDTQLVGALETDQLLAALESTRDYLSAVRRAFESA